MLEPSFQNLPILVREAPWADLPRLRGLLAEAETVLWARLFAGEPQHDRGGTNGPIVEDRNLSVGEAAGRLGVSRSWVYKNKKQLPFTVRIGRRVLFSALGLEKWQRQQRHQQRS